ncbi:uncharacterized protein KY384_006297 [Bacidia gigantensis]|uniref:uncharacterized protein n=1 Tax=Bacidia gigantensis TaxID=2732470 RepID=UPI001D0503D8|nr:uncharacterized protein KY384_006297 [Bacidia gigantensis]KAG8528610.1 hypothetical protein KY384_006297 [Bacidia gigantensis]
MDSPYGILHPLPLEIRRKIYSHTLSGRVILLRSLTFPRPQPGQNENALALLRVSKAIHEEAKTCIYEMMVMEYQYDLVLGDGLNGTAKGQISQKISVAAIDNRFEKWKHESYMSKTLVAMSLLYPNLRDVDEEKVKDLDFNVRVGDTEAMMAGEAIGMVLPVDYYTNLLRRFVGTGTRRRTFKLRVWSNERDEENTHDVRVVLSSLADVLTKSAVAVFVKDMVGFERVVLEFDCLSTTVRVEENADVTADGEGIGRVTRLITLNLYSWFEVAVQRVMQHFEPWLGECKLTARYVQRVGYNRQVASFEFRPLEHQMKEETVKWNLEAARQRWEEEEKLLASFEGD